MYDVFLTLSSPHFLGQFLSESRAGLAAVTGWEAPEIHLCLGSSCCTRVFLWILRLEFRSFCLCGEHFTD